MKKFSVKSTLLFWITFSTVDDLGKPACAAGDAVQASLKRANELNIEHEQNFL